MRRVRDTGILFQETGFQGMAHQVPAYVIPEEGQACPGPIRPSWSNAPLRSTHESTRNAAASLNGSRLSLMVGRDGVACRYILHSAA